MLNSGRTLSRRELLSRAGAMATAVGTGGLLLPGRLSAEPSSVAVKGGTSCESIVAHLYQSLSPGQREKIAFAWDHVDKQRGLLRTYISANWKITKPEVNSSFYTKDQRRMIRDIFEGIYQESWRDRVDQQLDDDNGGFGEGQAIAIFGEPGSDKFEFVLSGRHLTIRCDGNSTEKVAFGGPIFYGHDPDGTQVEDAEHTGNVYWEQAVVANKVFQLLDGKQQLQAQVVKSPHENAVGFRRSEEQTGIPISELSSDQQEHVQRVLQKLIEPYRKVDQDEVVSCLERQGGIQACKLAFYTDNDIGHDQVWDNWRLEGPSFVWHYRGSPHVHVWVHVAEDASPVLNS